MEMKKTPSTIRIHEEFTSGHDDSTTFVSFYDENEDLLWRHEGGENCDGYLRTRLWAEEEARKYGARITEDLSLSVKFGDRFSGFFVDDARIDRVPKKIELVEVSSPMVPSGTKKITYACVRNADGTLIKKYTAKSDEESFLEGQKYAEALAAEWGIEEISVTRMPDGQAEDRN